MANDDCFENKLWEKTNKIHNQYEENKEFYKAGWNAAIEKAALECYNGSVGYPITAEQIRKLKVK